MNCSPVRSIFALALCALAAPAWGLDGSVPAVNGHLSRTLLGDGTGVIIGIVDSGIDDTHPALGGLDSVGLPRLVAERNFVTSESFNTGDDIFGHGTWVASTALGNDPTYSGMASDARYINARVLDSGNGFSNDVQVRNGLGYAIEQGAAVISLSLNYSGTFSFGNTQLDLMIDWAAFEMGISCAVAVGNISQSNPNSSLVRGPGSAFNGVTVGRTTADFSRVHTDSAMAFTSDGRMKPDVVAPGTSLTLANDDWEGGAADWDANLSGTSFAAPHVAGLMAQQLEAGLEHKLSTDPLVVKATIMNSTMKVPDRLNNPWEPSSSQMIGNVFSTSRPLDTDSGTGQIDGLRLATQYLAGEKMPGAVDAVGWDFHTIGPSEFIDYEIDSSLIGGTTLSATLAWYRHVERIDTNGVIDAADSFFQSQLLSDLNLQVLRDGQLIGESVSTLDNVEHLYLDIQEKGQYTLRVFGANVYGGAEEFALAWFGFAVPEPGCLVLAIGATVGLLGARPRRAARTR